MTGVPPTNPYPPPPGYPASSGGPQPGYPAPQGYPPQPGYPQQYGAATPRYAGFWIRFGAMLLDSIALGIVAAVITIPFGGPTKQTCLTLNPDGTCALQGSSTNGAFVLAEIALSALYFSIMWGKGSTVGQRLLGLRVADANTGAPIGGTRGALRLVGYVVSCIPLYLGLIWAGFDPRKQGWHDKIASSVVVR